MAEANGDLIIGIGNTLRGDDGVGWWLAERAERLLRPQPAVLTVQQLTPELCEVLAAVRRVLFIDAWLVSARGDFAEGLEGRASCAPWIAPLPSDGLEEGRAMQSGLFSHTLEPSTLLALVMLLHDRAPQAWQLLVPAYRCAHGTDLSRKLRQSLPQAEALLQSWIKSNTQSATGNAGETPAREDSRGRLRLSSGEKIETPRT